MNYNINVNKIKIMQYKEILKNQYLIPSRAILRSNIDENFDKLLIFSINNLEDLKLKLSTNEKLKKFSFLTGIDEKYLTILKREINNLEIKSIPLKELLDDEDPFNFNFINNGILTSKDYYELYNNTESKNDIVKLFKVSIEKAEELYKLCDLVRIKGIGGAAAKCFYASGCKSVEDVANKDTNELLKKVLTLNENEKYYKVNLGENDIQYCIDFARLIIFTEKNT
jgi:replicative superfamily II helicase